MEAKISKGAKSENERRRVEVCENQSPVEESRQSDPHTTSDTSARQGTDKLDSPLRTARFSLSSATMRSSAPIELMRDKRSDTSLQEEDLEETKIDTPLSRRSSVGPSGSRTTRHPNTPLAPHSENDEASAEAVTGLSRAPAEKGRLRRGKTIVVGPHPLVRGEVIEHTALSSSTKPPSGLNTSTDSSGTLRGPIPISRGGGPPPAALIEAMSANLRGLAELAGADGEKAEREFARAAELDPSNPEYSANRAIAAQLVASRRSTVKENNKR